MHGRHHGDGVREEDDGGGEGEGSGEGAFATGIIPVAGATANSPPNIN